MPHLHILLCLVQLWSQWQPRWRGHTLSKIIDTLHLPSNQNLGQQDSLAELTACHTENLKRCLQATMAVPAVAILVEVKPAQVTFIVCVTSAIYCVDFVRYQNSPRGR